MGTGLTLHDRLMARVNETSIVDKLTRSNVSFDNHLQEAGFLRGDHAF